MNSEKEYSPLSGAVVVEKLTRAAPPDANWILFDIETLPIAGLDVNVLGDLWRKAKPFTISTTDLVSALQKANQVIVLDLKLSENSKINLYIEDGEIFEINL